MIVPKCVEEGGKGVFGALGFILISSIILVGGSVLGLKLHGVEFSHVDPGMFLPAMFYHRGPLHFLVASFLVYGGGVFLESRAGFLWYLFTFLVGGIIGEILQILLFSAMYPEGFVNGMESGGLAGMLAGLVLWPDERIELWLGPGRRRSTPAWIWPVFGILLVSSYYMLLMMKGEVASWGMLIGGIVSGVAMVPVLNILGVKDAYRQERMRAQTDAVISSVITSLGSEAKPRERLISEDPAQIEERMRERFARGDINGATLDAIRLMDLFLKRNRPDEARRIYVFVEEFIGDDVRIPGRLLIGVGEHCLDLALVDEAIDIAQKTIRTQFDTPNLDKFLFRLIETLIDTSSADFEEAEFLLSRYRLLSPPPQYYEYLRGKLYKKKADTEITETDRHIMELIASEYYEQALDEIRSLNDEVNVPPDELLTLARGLLMVPSVEDAAEVLAIIAHLHPEAAETPEAVYQLIQIFYEHLQDEDRAMKWFQFLKENFPNAPATTLAREYLDSIRRKRLQRR